MSKDKGDKDTATETQDAAQALEKKVRLNRVLLVIAIALFTLTLILLGAGFAIINSRINALANAPTEETDKQLEKIHADIAALQASTTQALAPIADFEASIKALRDNNESTRVLAIKTVFINREQDYQRLVDALRTGTDNLANMVSGPRDWIDFYNHEMDGLKKRSHERQVAIESTLPDDYLNNLAANKDAGKDAAKENPAPAKPIGQKNSSAQKPEPSHER